MNSFPTQKQEVNACFVWSGYSVFGFTDNQNLVARQGWMTFPSYKAKELWIAHDWTGPLHSACELLHTHSFLPNTDWVITELKSVSMLHANNSIICMFWRMSKWNHRPMLTYATGILTQSEESSTLLKLIVLSNSTKGNCPPIQAVKQPVCERASNTTERNYSFQTIYDCNSTSFASEDSVSSKHHLIKKMWNTAMKNSTFFQDFTGWTEFIIYSKKKKEKKERKLSQSYFVKIFQNF